ARGDGPARREPRRVDQHAGASDALARGSSTRPRGHPRRQCRRRRARHARPRGRGRGAGGPLRAKDALTDPDTPAYSPTSMKRTDTRLLSLGLILLALPGLTGASASYAQA